MIMEKKISNGIDSRNQIKAKRKDITQYVEIYPMMPRGFTATQRAELRQFERELLTEK